MPLPYLQSYNDPKIQKAYTRYLEGQPQRKIAAALKIAPRTLARYCKNDGWEAERKARAITESAPNVAAAAAAGSSVAATAGAALPPDVPTEAPTGTRAARMEQMLSRQQRIVGRLVAAYEKDVDKTLTDAEASGARGLSRSQISQLTLLGNNLLAMERKAWCVPDKIETKDTTPTPVDPIRNLTDDQLERELAAERGADSTATERTGAATPAREEPKESVN